MKLFKTSSEERGSALLEFVFYAVFLQVGLLLTGIQLFGLQATQLQAESAARHGLRSFISNGVAPQETANQVLKDFGSQETANVQLSCNPDCYTDDSLVSITVVIGQASAVASAIR